MEKSVIDPHVVKLATEYWTSAILRITKLP
jgi:hypothetical protein